MKIAIYAYKHRLSAADAKKKLSGKAAKSPAAGATSLEPAEPEVVDLVTPSVSTDMAIDAGDEDDVDEEIFIDGTLTATLLQALSDEARSLLVDDDGDFDVEAAYASLQVSAEKDSVAAAAVKLIEEQVTVAAIGRGRRRKKPSAAAAAAAADGC
jgi:hypothetical protein